MAEPEADTPDEVVASVADSIRALHGVPFLTQDEIEQREIANEQWRERQQWYAEQQRIERERIEAARAEAQRREAAVAQQEAHKKARLESSERMAQQIRDNELRNLHYQAAQHSAWQRNLENSARNAFAMQQRQALINELEAMVNPPPEPEPRIVVVEREEEEPTGWLSFVKPIRWR